VLFLFLLFYGLGGSEKIAGTFLVIEWSATQVTSEKFCAILSVSTSNNANEPSFTVSGRKGARASGGETSYPNCHLLSNRFMRGLSRLTFFTIGARDMMRSTVCAWLFEGKSARGPQNVSVLALDELLLHSEKCNVTPAKIYGPLNSPACSCVSITSPASFAIWPRPFVEDGAHSLAVEPQTESIFLRKLGDFCLSVFLVQWPDAFQVSLVNSAMRPRFAMHLAFDLFRERFHRCLDIAGKV